MTEKDLQAILDAFIKEMQNFTHELNKSTEEFINRVNETCKLLQS